jgi:hypothetical protein
MSWRRVPLGHTGWRCYVLKGPHQWFQQEAKHHLLEGDGFHICLPARGSVHLQKQKCVILDRGPLCLPFGKNAIYRRLAGDAFF